ncbi:MAG: MATE family efflux transporter, partial [Prevotellaceae bacterium]|nr:MATE family efflux transporter [Prevotellaceae bacterium]
MQGVKNLTTGSIYGRLISLAMPIMATSFIQMAYSLTDMAWVGRLGSEAVAAVGAVGILTWMSGSISLLNKVGSEVSIAQSIGARNEADARAFASHNVSMALLLSLVLGVLLFALARPVMSLFALEPHIEAQAVSYLHIISTGFPFFFLSASFTGIYNAAGRSTVPFYISGTGLVMNMVLDPLFIFVFDGGVIGAAWATWLSQLVVFALFVRRLRFKDRLLGGFPFFTRFRRRYALHIVRLGLPAAA